MTLGATSYTYTKTRIRVVDHREEPWSHKGIISLNNADGTLSSLDFRGYKAVLSTGVKTSAGDEYSAKAPLCVSPQSLLSGPGQLTSVLLLRGLPDMLDEDKASGIFIPSLTQSVKDIINGVLGATVDVFSGCYPYTPVWDSEDAASLAHTFLPKQNIIVMKGQSRLAVLQQAFQYCQEVMRFEADGQPHIFLPRTDVTSETIRPNGAGDETGLTISGATPNWNCVDEVTADEATTNVSTVSATYVEDLYTIPVITIPGTISSITVYFRCYSDSATITQASAYAHIKTNGAEHNGTAETLSGTWTTFSKTWTLNPETGVAWTMSDIRALQIGVGMRKPTIIAANTSYCTQVYLVVNYTYDYEYSNTSGEHNLKSKDWREKVVIPNKVNVSSLIGDVPQYGSAAADASCGTTWAANTAYVVGNRVEPVTPNNQFTYECSVAGTSHAATEPTWPTTEGETVTDGTVTWTTLAIQRHDSFENLRLESDAQGAAIAAAMLAKNVLSTDGGSILVPVNAGQEVFDYIKAVDPWQGDTRTGSVGYVHTKINLEKQRWDMELGFGGWLAKQSLAHSLVDSAAGMEVGQLSVTNIAANFVTNVGDELAKSNDTETFNNTTNYVKVREILIPCWGYFRIKFDLYQAADPDDRTAYGQLYITRAGVQTTIGAEMSTTSPTYVTKSQDLGSFKPGDLLQLYIKIGGANAAAYEKNLRLYVQNVTIITPYLPGFVTIL